MSGNRHEALRWLKQGEKDLSSARNSLESGDYEWACFQSQQSAEKALRKILTHSIFELVSEVGRTDPSFLRLTRQAKALDGVYISSRYPNGIAGELVPGEYYDQEDADGCISCAGLILAEVKSCIGS